MRWEALWLGAVCFGGCVINPQFDVVDTDGSTDATTGTTMASATASETEVGPGESLPDPCPPLGPPDGPTIDVAPAQAAELGAIIDAAESGTTIVLEPGTYPVVDRIRIGVPGITLRSSTGNPQDVVLEGDGIVESILSVRAADFTVAELTLHRAGEHAVHLTGSGEDPAPRFFGYRLIMTDAGASTFKVNPGSLGSPADDGVLACSRMSLSDARRDELGANCQYIGGFLGIASYGWHVRDNTIEDIWCPAGYPAAGIRFMESSADPIVERNRIHDCANGIIFGVYEDSEPLREYDGERCDGGFYDHYGGLIANNVVTATGTGIAASEYGLDAGIGLWQVCDTTVVHNTVASAIGAYSSIEYRYSRTQASVVNNLVTDEIRDRNDAGVPIAGNLQLVDLSSFVDPLAGDVHLLPTSEAVDAGILLGDDAVFHDMDGDPRTDPPDVGADELDP